MSFDTVNSMTFYERSLFKLTSFHRAVDMIFGLIVDPVKASLHSQLGEETILLCFSVIGGYVHSPAFIVQRARRMVAVFIPGLCHA